MRLEPRVSIMMTFKFCEINYIDGLAQDYSKLSAKALELLQYCGKPWLSARIQ